MGQLKRPKASKLSTIQILMFHFLHGPLEKGVEENHGACMPISYDHLVTTIAFSYATYKKI